MAHIPYFLLDIECAYLAICPTQNGFEQLAQGRIIFEPVEAFGQLVTIRFYPERKIRLSSTVHKCEEFANGHLPCTSGSDQTIKYINCQMMHKAFIGKCTTLSVLSQIDSIVCYAYCDEWSPASTKFFFFLDEEDVIIRLTRQRPYCINIYV